MYARVTTLHTRGGGQTAKLLSEAAEHVFPMLVSQRGCAGAFVLNDPVSGTVGVVVLWRNAEDMLDSKDLANLVSVTTAEVVGSEVENFTVQVFDVTSYTAIDEINLTHGSTPTDLVPPARSARPRETSV